ncbi:hypothetical protein GGS23DRAFT_554085 [Durotheca rogersii]|uniref:uncharacterized protein n=1 Tax=Durotheca rogersii TaxID=419775 RepID=UPI00221FC473|nr:uncharacterized protein GGS23DRAFT_554085 [Durotheca rogersii]KAI5865767.1 hypothetical protein GGS23DRAFT_554085 [Durotheca rogersii]
MVSHPKLTYLALSHARPCDALEPAAGKCLAAHLLTSAQVRRGEIRDIDLSIRFKYGVHTVFLFVDPTKPFGDAAGELLEILKLRYPAGLKASAEDPDPTPLPADALQIEFALPKVAADLSQGWAPLHVKEGDTPANKGLKDNSVIAFAFRPEDADEDYEPVFNVDFPTYEDEGLEE